MMNNMSSENKRISQSNKSALRNPWVLGWLGLLSLVVIVNVGMITTAFVTSPGLVEKDYYEKGRDHEQNFLKKRTARNALGWSFRLDIPEEVTIGQKTAIRFSIVDKFGVALKDINIDLLAYRPSDASADINKSMQVFAPGQYQADVRFTLKGAWDLQVNATKTAEKGNTETYELINQRINVVTQ
jgi:nitrogen fixation protein FixH